jgi:hypothetical protein
MTTPPSLAGSARLGSEDDWIRQGLFGCQSMNELLRHVKPSGAGPFRSIDDANKLATEGRVEDAKSVLRNILSTPDLETRVELWVWSALRELHEQPEPKLAFEILGAIVEVPMQGAFDTLAGYKDGTARYLNFSGKAIFWDAKDITVQRLCQALLASLVPAASQFKPRLNVSLPKSGTQVTLLSRSGMFTISDPPMPILKIAAGLMNELIRRTSEKRSEKAD